MTSCKKSSSPFSGSTGSTRLRGIARESGCISGGPARLQKETRNSMTIVS